MSQQGARTSNDKEYFSERHLGLSPSDEASMLGSLGVTSRRALVDEALPSTLTRRDSDAKRFPLTEPEALKVLQTRAAGNQNVRPLIGMGYSPCHLPAVIRRNIFENPGWYTQYTPYQAEIAQGRLEALINFQTMVADLVGLPLSNASLLDEPTAAAEAMGMCWAIDGRRRNRFFVCDDTHPQTIAVLKTRAEPLGIELILGSPANAAWKDCFGVYLQSPNTSGQVVDVKTLADRAHADGAQVVVGTDLLASTLFAPVGGLGADIAVGSAQRFGVPLGGGGPHAAFLCTRMEHRRFLPGRLVGVSVDANGKMAYRLALQTREQHIRRDRATSNICTSQVLLAVIASMYAVYHGSDGLTRIARGVRALTETLAAALTHAGFEVAHGPRFDTLRVLLGTARQVEVLENARRHNLNFRAFEGGDIGVSLDETCDVSVLVSVLASFSVHAKAELLGDSFDGHYEGLPVERTSPFLTHETFSKYRTEHEMLRYIRRLERRDLSLAHSMIPLGSCTMKLNATSEMIPVGWEAFSSIHPYAPMAQQKGFVDLTTELGEWLIELTGFKAISFQPNAGSQGEYAGLLAIRGYHQARGQTGRKKCLIPVSAHGTNPASAAMAGFDVVPVACTENGDIDLADLEAKAKAHHESLAAMMVTYPSTHGVFEAGITTACEIVHAHGGLVYLDGANMNAMLGVLRPADFGVDVCHLNLHKTFCIPHGGGGPGMGPILVGDRLKEFLPGDPLLPVEAGSVGAVSAARFGSASILPISWMYLALMGSEGVLAATEVAILNANYLANRLSSSFPILFRGPSGRVAHEFIIDLRPFKKSARVEVDDVAKRLMDFGFHAPTVSWPVAGTMMIEPTESESKAELDRFCEAMEQIRAEIRDIEEGRVAPEASPLKYAPHTMETLALEPWPHTYSRQQACFPLPWVSENKFWPARARIDNAAGDRQLFCSCPTPDWASDTGAA
jgi:glycine dehydrogenase